MYFPQLQSSVPLGNFDHQTCEKLQSSGPIESTRFLLKTIIIEMHREHLLKINSDKTRAFKMASALHLFA